MADELTISIRLEWEGDSIERGSVDWVDNTVTLSSNDLTYNRVEIDTAASPGKAILAGIYTAALGGYIIAINSGNPTGAAKPIYIASDSGNEPLVKLLDGGPPAIFRVSPNAVSLRAHKDNNDSGDNPILEFWYFEP